MIPIEEQELPDFQRLTDEAKEKISMLYPLWSNFNPADSGMAVLELFVYLTELQQFYAGQIGSAHILAFLHLLGTSPDGMIPARVCARKYGGTAPFYLLAGTKARAGALVWEVEKTVYMEPEPVFASDPNCPFYPFGENPDFFSVYELKLTQELNMNVVHTLYFELADGYPIPRNEIDKECFFSLVKLHFEYYNGQVYQSCHMLEDTTFGLLQTGFVQFRLPDRMEPENGTYILRICVEGEYDIAPLLNSVSFHTASLVQKDTKVEMKEYLLSCSRQEKQEIVLDFWNGVYGETRAYKRVGEGFQSLQFSSYVLDGMRHLVFENKELFGAEEFCETEESCGTEEFCEAKANREAEETVVIRLVSVEKGYDSNFLTRKADGSPGQVFFLKDPHVLGSGFALWLEEQPDYYVPWRRVVDFAAAGPLERCYVLEEEKGILRFGDGRHGRIPKGQLEITGYALCAGLSGNMQKNQTLEFVHGSGLSYLGNPLPAAGGRNPETVKECLERYKEQSSIQERAVTAADYERLIRRTPGLRIKKAKVFPSGRQDNCLEAVVQPYTNAGRIMQTDLYLKNIMRYLEKRKMLGTGIRILKPQYIALTLQAEVLVKSRFPGAEETVRESIWAYFDSHMDFGKTIIYSKLYGYIDSMPQTSGIRELSLHAEGKGVIRRENGDITLLPYGIAHLKTLEIRCLLESR